MTFVFFIIIVVVVMQTAFAHVRSSTSAQELENAEFLDAFKSLQESILAQIPKKEARLKTSKLIGAKDVSAESFQISGKRGGKMYTSGWAYNVTKSVKDCNSGNVQYITARPLYCKISPNHMNPDSPNSFAEMCFWDRNRKTIEYRAGYWTGSTNCNNYNTPPDTINDSEFGIGPYCNLDENGFGVFSGCGNRRYIQPADSPEDESIVLEFYGGESEDCEMELPPEILQAFPLNGCIQTPKKKGKRGGVSFVDCTASGSLIVRYFESSDCKGAYREVQVTSDMFLGAGGSNCMPNEDGDVVKYTCNKAM